jgi:hypothetical protein
MDLTVSSVVWILLALFMMSLVVWLLPHYGKNWRKDELDEFRLSR